MALTIDVQNVFDKAVEISPVVVVCLVMIDRTLARYYANLKAREDKKFLRDLTNMPVLAMNVQSLAKKITTLLSVFKDVPKELYGIKQQLREISGIVTKWGKPPSPN